MIFVLMLFAFGMRLYHISYESLCFDEALTYTITKNTIPEMFASCIALRTPFLYYSGIYIWQGLFGSTEAALRIYSIFWSLLTIYMIYLCVKKVFSEKAAYVALILAAINPFDIYFSQEAGIYTQAAAFGFLSTYFLWRWMEILNKTDDYRDWGKWALAYIPATFLLLLTDYSAIPFILSQTILALYCFIRVKRPQIFIVYILSLAAAFLLFLPWLLYSLNADITLPAGYDFSTATKPVFSDIFSYPGKFFIWGFLSGIWQTWWIPSIILIAGAAGYGIYNYNMTRMEEIDGEYSDLPRITFFLFMLLAPPAAAYFIHLIFANSFQIEKFAIYVLPYFIIVLSLSLNNMKYKSAGYILGILIAGVFLFSSFTQANTIQKEKWNEMLHKIPRDTQISNAFFYPPYISIPLKYYLEKDFHNINYLRTNDDVEKISSGEINVFTKEITPKQDIKIQKEILRTIFRKGSVKNTILDRKIFLQTVKVGDTHPAVPNNARFSAWYDPVDVPGQLEGFVNAYLFYDIETDSGQETYRRGRSKGALALFAVKPKSKIIWCFEMPQQASPDYNPDIKFYCMEASTSQILFDTPPVKQYTSYEKGKIEAEIISPDKETDVYIGYSCNPAKSSDAGIPSTGNDFGLKTFFVGIEKENYLSKDEKLKLLNKPAEESNEKEKEEIIENKEEKTAPAVSPTPTAKPAPAKKTAVKKKTKVQPTPKPALKKTTKKSQSSSKTAKKTTSAKKTKKSD